jgi:uncharacterized membrane protein
MSSSTKFEFTSKLKRTFIAMFVIGLAAVLIGILSGQVDQQKTWANFLLNSVYFTGISAIAIFFLAAHHLAFAGWHVLIKRIPEAMSQFVWIGAIFLIVIVLGTKFGYHDLYHWSDEFITQEHVTTAELEAYEAEHAGGHGAAEGHGTEGEHGEEHSSVSGHHEVVLASGGEGAEHGSGTIENPYYDKIIDGKSAYLNDNFFILRSIIYLGLWSFFAFQLRKYSLQEEMSGDLKWYHKTRMSSVLFIAVWAVSSSMMAWDWVMSLDPHWFSTLFGWYNFISLFVGGLSTIVLILIYLKSKGYMVQANENHLHDLGKYVFGFSVFWTYLWFSQFMLYWYGNIPEETIWFLERKREYGGLFAANVIINFLLPFFVLMRRDAKRNMTVIGVIATVLVVSHWIDFYLMILPSTVHGGAPIGYFEVGMLVAFAGLFLYVVFNALTKVSLVPQNSPLLKESLDHHI